MGQDTTRSSANEDPTVPADRLGTSSVSPKHEDRRAVLSAVEIPKEIHQFAENIPTSSG